MNGVLKIVTRDVFLGQKLYRELSSRFSHVEIAENPSGTADLWLFDTRTHKPEADAPQFFYLAADTKALPEERTLPLPLPIGLAEKMLGQKKASPLILLANERALRLYGRQIKLTEVEYALLRAIVEADGIAFVEESENGMLAEPEADAEAHDSTTAHGAPTCELSIQVESVDTACNRIQDLVQEYEAKMDLQRVGDSQANIYVEIDSVNADDFLNAVVPMDSSGQPVEYPDLPEGGHMLVLLVIHR